MTLLEELYVKTLKVAISLIDKGDEVGAKRLMEEIVRSANNSEENERGDLEQMSSLEGRL